jgi:hypothetical protein
MIATNKQVVVEKSQTRSLPEEMLHANLPAVLHADLPPPKNSVPS